jgi:hypothetical protein
MGKHRIRTILLAAAAGGGLIVAAGVPAAQAESGAGANAASATSAAVTSQTGQPGLATRVVRTAASSAPTSAPSSRPRGARLLPRSATAGAASAPVAAPAAPAAASATANPLLASFDGTSSKDSQFTNFNAKFEPPDQGLCAGAGFVLEPVNSAYRIYRTTGTSIRGPFNVNELFNEGGKEFTSDPRCWYDPTTHTWFATILFLNDTFTEGRLDIAVNPNSNPTGLWNEYQIDNTFDGRNGEPNLPGCPCFGDQPRIGIDQTNLYVTTDEFSINGPQFYGGQIYAISKADLVKGVASPHFVRFGNLRLGGSLAGAPQPALSIGSPPAEYFLSELDPTGNGDNRIGVWAMTNRNRVATGGSPTLSKVVISSEPYAIPPGAQQKGATSLLDSGDDRMQQASFVNGTLWGELTTNLRPAGDTTDRAGAAWFQVRPKLSGNRIGGATVVRQGYVSVRGGDVMYPAVQPDAAGNAAMVFTIAGPTRFASVGYSVLSGGGTQFSAPAVAGAGTGPYDPKATRWGDYSFAVPDWGSDGAWLASEYVPPVSSQTTTGERNWGTRVIRVSLG